MTQARHHSPVPAIESPVHINHVSPTKAPLPDPVSESPFRKSPSVEPVESSPVDEHPVGPSKMPMSPSIEYLDDDEYDEDDDDDKFNDDHMVPSNIPLRPPPTSISTIRLSQQNRAR